MKSTLHRRGANAAWLCLALLTLQACSPASSQPSRDISVAEAFQSSSVIRVKPYTRTIFSSNDF